MNITEIKIADFCEDQSTIEVIAEVNGAEQTFYVQTTDGEYRSDLGCWITTPEDGEDIDQDDYPDFDICEVISAAESFLSDQCQEVATDEFIDGNRVYLVGERRVTENPRYINKDTSSYQRKWIDIDEA